MRAHMPSWGSLWARYRKTEDTAVAFEEPGERAGRYARPLHTAPPKWKSSRSAVSDSATRWTAAHQAPPSLGFSRQEHCSGLPSPSPGDLPDPGIEPKSPALQADALPAEPAGTPSTTKGEGRQTKPPLGPDPWAPPSPQTRNSSPPSLGMSRITCCLFLLPPAAAGAPVKTSLISCLLSVSSDEGRPKSMLGNGAPVSSTNKRDL